MTMPRTPIRIGPSSCPVSNVDVLASWFEQQLSDRRRALQTNLIEAWTCGEITDDLDQTIEAALEEFDEAAIEARRDFWTSLAQMTGHPEASH